MTIAGNWQNTHVETPWPIAMWCACVYQVYVYDGIMVWYQV